jgi:LysM repeat protein|tara:strand:+ start:440 stop:724 length:285 start_codon:yes stop_codon:yes gene_type:complete
MRLDRRQLRRLIESVINEGFNPDDHSIGNYKVKSGDTLSGIAQKECPAGCTSTHLKKLNNIKDADKLSIDQNIKIYIPKEKEGTDSPPTPPMKK